MSARRYVILLSVALSCATALAGEIYKTTDEDGNVVFTDSPPPGSEAGESVEISPINSLPPPSVSAPAEPPELVAEDPNDSEAAAPTVAITSPADETTIPMGGGIFDVTAEVSSDLGSGRELQLFMDGEPQGPPQAMGAWQLNNVFRGPHDLTVKVVDQSGKVLSSSESVRVYVMRPSIR